MVRFTAAFPRDGGLDMRKLTGVVSLFLFATGCPSDHGFVDNNDAHGANGPQIQVSPESIDFGALGREETVVDMFTVTNVGEGDLEVSGIEITGTSTSFAILTPEEDLSFTLPATASAEIEVSFTPLGANDQFAQAIVSSNDADTAKASVDLLGEGLIPDLEIDPNPYDFGDAYIGCMHSGDIDLVNVGHDDLTIDTIDLTGGSGAFTITQQPALPLTLAPEEWTTVSVDFYPEDESDHSSILQVTSDAPGGTDRGDVEGRGIYAGEYTDAWEIPFDPPVDLLFSVDQSGSMDDDAARLADNFATFISQLSGYTTDWQIIVSNYDDGCNRGGILTASTSGYMSIFREQVALPNGWNKGRYTEALLTVAAQTVENTDSGECNQRFMRPDALLHIILVSDEPEQSPSSWSTYVSQIQAKKGSVSNVKISAIAGDYPGGCGSAQAGTGYYEAVQATGGEFLSICGDWGEMVEDLADASVELSEYELSHTADPSTLVVRVNGTEVGGTVWHYDETVNSVIFDRSVPVGGDTVRISYSAFANCD
jgi:hypothetical protein